MRLDLFFVLVLGYFMQLSDAVNQEKEVHINIHIPHLVHKEYDDATDNNNGRITLHTNGYSPEDGYSHNQNYEYSPEKKHYPKQKKSGKKKSKKQKKKKYGDDKDFREILENYDPKPEKSSNDGGYKTSVHTEHYEVKKINPNARFPDEKYIIQGAYKVQETDPWGAPVTEFHEYDSPISKITANILSKYDFTNFRPEDEFNKKNDEDSSHDNIEHGGNSASNHDDYGYNKKKEPERYISPKNDQNYNVQHGGNSASNHDDYGYNKKKEPERYSSPKNNQNYIYEVPNTKKSEEYNGPTNTQGYSYEVPYTKVSEEYNNPKISHEYTYDVPYTKSQRYTSPKKVQDYNYNKPVSNGKDYEKSAGYEGFVQKKAIYKAPQNYGPVLPSHEDLHSKQINNEKKEKITVYVVPQVYGNFKAGDSKRVENAEKLPVQVEYISPHDQDSVTRELEYEFEKEFGHLVTPSHSDSHYGYDNDYEKHLIDYLYGSDHAASTKFEHRVKPDNRKKL